MLFSSLVFSFFLDPEFAAIRTSIHEFNGVQFPYLETDIGDSQIEILLDTGAPSAYLHKQRLQPVDLNTAGTVNIPRQGQSAITADLVLELEFTASNCAGRCQFTSKNIEVFDHIALERTPFEGAYNLNQLTERGCIFFDLRANTILKFSNENRKCVRKKRGMSTVELNDLFEASFGSSNGRDYNALFDTGSPFTIVNSRTISTDRELVKTGHTISFYDAQHELYVAEDIHLNFANQEFFYPALFVTFTPLPRDIDAIIGLDTLSSAVIFVGENQNPYMQFDFRTLEVNFVNEIITLDAREKQ